MRTPGRTFRTELKTELEKMSAMTLREKVSYFFTYYKHLIVIFVVLCFAVFLIGDWIAESRKEVVLEGFFTNDEWDLFNASKLADDYHSAFPLEGRQGVRFDDTLYISMDGTVTEFSSASASKIVVYLRNKQLDFIITVEPVYDYYTGSVYMWDLRELLPEDLLTKVEDYLIYSLSADGTEEGAYGLDLTDCRYVAGVGADKEPLVDDTYVMFVPESAPHPEALIEYIRFLFDWE